MRPRFSFEVDLPRDQVIDRLSAALEEQRWPLKGAVSSEHVDLRMNEAERHFWSPWLTLWIEDRGQRSQVRGRFGPHPEVWTLFVGLYAAVVLSSGAITLYGIAQWMIDQPAWGLWAAPVGLVGVLGVWAAAFVGQGLSAAQTVIMRGLVGAVLADAAGGVTAVGEALALVSENTPTAPADLLAQWRLESRPAAGSAAAFAMPKRGAAKARKR